MRSILAFVVFIISIILAVYIGGWLLFFKPIIDLCTCIDEGNVTAVAVGITALKCLFASAVSSIIIWVGSFAATLINK